jgi:hypothetical protein
VRDLQVPVRCGQLLAPHQQPAENKRRASCAGVVEEVAQENVMAHNGGSAEHADRWGWVECHQADLICPCIMESCMLYMQQGFCWKGFVLPPLAIF